MFSKTCRSMLFSKNQTNSKNIFSKVLFGVGSGLVVGVLTQNYLAKEKSTSPWYWRNMPGLSDGLFQLAHGKYFDRIMSLSKVFSGAQFNTLQLIKCLQIIYPIIDLKILFDKIDDTIDNARPETILALSEPSLGPELSPFLSNLLDTKDLEILDSFIHNELITKEELYSFGNLLANKLVKQANLTQEYENEVHPKQKTILRKQISMENIEIAGAYLALIVHFIKKDERIRKLVYQKINNQLTYEVLKEVYPEATKAGELMQIVHDVPEFRYDRKHEGTIGKISANSFLAVLEEKGLLEQHKELLNNLPDRPVSYHELPKEIQLELTQIEKDFKLQSASIGYFAKLIFSFSWEYERLVGFYTDKPRH